MNIEVDPLWLYVGGGVVCVVMVASLRMFWMAWEDRRERINRTALSQVEARSSTLRYRLDNRLRRTKLGKRVELELARGDIGWTPLAAVTALAAGGMLVFVIVNSLAPAWAALLSLVGVWQMVKAWVASRREARLLAVVVQLPEVARTISNAASAGRSLSSAIQLAARELDDPMRSELALVAEEMRVGAPVEEALGRLQRRLPSRDVAVMVTTLIIQQRSGGDVVAALRQMAETLEKRKDLAGEIKSLMAGPVYTGYAVIGLGLAALVLLNASQPGAINDLLNSWVGRGAALISGLLYAFGMFLIKREQAVDV